MTKLFFSISVITISSLTGMELSERQAVQLFRRTASQEAIHSPEYVQLHADQTTAANHAELARISGRLNVTPAIPPAPVFKPRAKPAAPPAPAQPESFYAKNKRAIWTAGIGAGTVVTGAILLRLIKNGQHEDIDLILNTRIENGG